MCWCRTKTSWCKRELSLSWRSRSWPSCISMTSRSKRTPPRPSPRSNKPGPICRGSSKKKRRHSPKTTNSDSSLKGVLPPTKAVKCHCSKGHRMGCHQGIKRWRRYSQRPAGYPVRGVSLTMSRKKISIRPPVRRTSLIKITPVHWQMTWLWW